MGRLVIAPDGVVVFVVFGAIGAREELHLELAVIVDRVAILDQHAAFN